MPTLNWLTRDEDIGAAKRVPYRLLEEVPDQSSGELDTGNMLIQGDNLEALKALLPFFAGRVKCIYIDPPFNTRQAFEDYDDNMEYTLWLGLMYARFELLRRWRGGLALASEQRLLQLRQLGLQLRFLGLRGL
ncbi:MAG: hypothetical protein OXC19_24030 [Bryobacterales bacterium]|nr:hypothetical protein [Bryobacterales bacterium]